MLPHDELGDGPAVVLLHAGVADRTMWSEHLEPLAAAGYRPVAFELSGFGEAPIGSGPWAPWSDVLGAMDELGIERAAVVGNSFGGAVALRIAVTAPDRVSALALVSAPAPGIEPSPELMAAWEQEEEALERGDVDAAVAAVVGAWTLSDAPAALRERVAAMQRRTFELQGDVAHPDEAPDPLDDDPDAVRTIEIPALISVGERDKIDFRDGAQALAEALPNARHAVIAGAGHLAPLERPEQFRELLLEFLSASR
jgi:pimeloyl-ACP methyl ester carboxylesterase